MGNAFTTINPATGGEIDTFDQMSDSVVDSAIERCHEAFLSWRETSLKERGRILRQVGQIFRERKEDIAALMSKEMGKLIDHSRQEVDLCAAICDWTADNAPQYLGDEERELMQGKRGVVTYSPIGVVYGIQPWNFPLYQAVRYSVASLIAGNGVLLKHASNVFGSAALLQELYEQGGLPKNLFTSLFITHDQSDDVIRHKLVRGVTLTGSEDAGAHVAKIAGEELKKTVLELGSNDAYLVLADADLDLAVKACVQGRIYNNGETCVAAKRFIIVEDVYEQFRDKYVAAMKDLTFGDPFDEATDIGPMAREDLRDKLHSQVEESVKNGARILCGGDVPSGDGYYYPATVLEDVKPGQPAYDDELFGPVASLIRAKDAEDAMRIANDSRYGLGGGIFTQDIEGAVKLACEKFDTGMVFVNGFGLAQPMMPFGGVKNSGYGREHGGSGMREFTNEKSIFIMTD